jgi:serine/threonine-protein kinase SRPK3
MVFKVLGENLLSLLKRHQIKGVHMPLVRQIAKQVLQGLDYMHRCCGVIQVVPRCARVLRVDHPDLKPENVLICINDVESIIQSELAISASNPASPPTKLVGVPPSKGRGGEPNPTLRVYLNTQFPTASISIFFIGLESDVGQIGFWDE